MRILIPASTPAQRVARRGTISGAGASDFVEIGFRRGTHESDRSRRFAVCATRLAAGLARAAGLIMQASDLLTVLLQAALTFDTINPKVSLKQEEPGWAVEDCGHRIL